MAWEDIETTAGDKTYIGKWNEFVGRVYALIGGITSFGTAAEADIGTGADDVAAGNHTHASYAPLASPTFTGTPAAPTATAGTNTTQIATTAFVRGEVAALVDTAPGALDTLNELAAALGDDADFAGTVTTALAAKAPLASPTFTGTPAAPTATAGTNTTQVATCEFVTTAVAGAGGGGFVGIAREIYINAGAMVPSTTNGAAFASTENSTNKHNWDCLAFDASTQEFACFEYIFPQQWNAGTIKAKFVWTAASGSGDVVWALEAVALSDDDATDTAYGTAQQVADTLLTANDIHTTGATPAITIAGTPAAGDLIQFRVKRVPSDGSDTLGVDAKLRGVLIQYIESDTEATPW